MSVQKDVRHTFFRRRGHPADSDHHYNGYAELLNSTELFLPKRILVRRSDFDKTSQTISKTYFEFFNLSYGAPFCTDEYQRKRPLTVEECIQRDMTYEMPLIGSFHMIEEIWTGSENDDTAAPSLTMTSSRILHTYTGEVILFVPCLVNGAFIIDGKEKVVIPYERTRTNIPFVTNSKKGLVVSMISKSKQGEASQYIKVLDGGKHSLLIEINQIFEKPVSVFAVIKAMGITSDKELCDAMGSDQRILTALLFHLQRWKATQTQNPQNSHSELPIRERYRKSFPNNVMPHITRGDARTKAVHLAFMTKMLLEAMNGMRQVDDIDHYRLKAFDHVGDILLPTFRLGVKNMVRLCKKNLSRAQSDIATDANLTVRWDPVKFKTIVHSFMMSGLLKTTNDHQKCGVVQSPTHISRIQSDCLKRQISSSVANTRSRSTKPREYHPSTAYFVSPVETQEGGNIGLDKQLALSATFATSSLEHVDNILEIVQPFLATTNAGSSLFIHGEIVGYTTRANDLLAAVRSYKLSAPFESSAKFIGIVCDRAAKTINIVFEGGRLVRPVLVVTDGSLVLNSFNLSVDNIPYDCWEDLYDETLGAFEYIDSWEADYLLIATTQSELQLRARQLNMAPPTGRLSALPGITHTHCEIVPSLMLGTVSANIPLSPSNPSPRNAYESAQMKQAISRVSLNPDNIEATQYELLSPQRSIMITQYMQKINECGGGQNVVVAFMSCLGFNLEDSIIMSAGAIDRGLFNTNLYKVYSDACCMVNDKHAFPPPTSATKRSADVSHLDEMGVARIGTKLAEDMVVVGKVITDGQESVDKSVLVKRHELGVVDRVIKTKNAAGYSLVKVRSTHMKPAETGDKFSSRHGQKGTIAKIMPEEDMPYMENGVRPDIIFNPHGIPSRMTIGQIKEMVLATYGAMVGTHIDGTPFEEVRSVVDHALPSIDPTNGRVLTMEEAADAITKMLGLSEGCTTVMYDGLTGEPLQSTIFAGVAYYQRLKHMVSHKIQARKAFSTGKRANRCIITRQPVGGRVKDGATRVGEMERDCLIAHGLAKFIEEKYMQLCDEHKTIVCNSCNNIAYPLASMRVACSRCKSVFPTLSPDEHHGQCVKCKKAELANYPILTYSCGDCGESCVTPLFDIKATAVHFKEFEMACRRCPAGVMTATMPYGCKECPEPHDLSAVRLPFAFIAFMNYLKIMGINVAIN